MSVLFADIPTGHDLVILIFNTEIDVISGRGQRRAALLGVVVIAGLRNGCNEEEVKEIERQEERIRVCESVATKSCRRSQ